MDVVVVAARRSPIGSFLGALSSVPAPVLGAAPIRAALDDAAVRPETVDELLLGCVLSGGLGQNPAKQAALTAGLPAAVPCTLINKVCGSSMRAVMFGADAIRAGSASTVVAGGMESMSGAPYLLPKARRGLRFGHQETLDHMLLDGLQNAADGRSMGVLAEEVAAEYALTRERQDAFAAESVARTLAAIEQGRFDREIVPVTVEGRRGERERVDRDEEPFRCNIAKIPHLKPAFAPDGTITAASSSSIADGAAALVLMSTEAAEASGLAPLVKVVAAQTHAHAPERFATATIGAIDKLLQRLDWSDRDVDLYEINEAFACVTLLTMQQLGIEHEKVNVNGGACALGHPIGATGARVLVTLIHALRDRGARRGIAAACIGGGEATAIAVETVR